uniref:Uncharacterized protein n=1 Tax=Prymnesium polylepis TaxID=72548 RepID=A0A7S4HRD1_9EUKA|mmetsp:Transcript_21238/g.52137  ORF Transcript_21238/g.52137 Transcript_21238/m.52137 type:complete len:149 (+) Transcript_21238:284-730(+)
MRACAGRELEHMVAVGPSRRHPCLPRPRWMEAVQRVRRSLVRRVHGKCSVSPAGSSDVLPMRYQRPGGIVGQSCVVKAKKESGLLPVTLSISGALRFATTFPKSITLSVYTAAVTGSARWRTSPAKSKQDDVRERGERIALRTVLSAR